MINKQQKMNPDYGIDGPDAIRNLIISGVIMLAASVFLFRFSGELLKIIAVILIILGCFFMTCAAWIFIYAKTGKFRHRDRILGMISLKGNEQVLDIGTGRGLLMIGIAKKLTTGKSIGIDIWSRADLTANTYENAVKNAELEGVREKVEVKNMDAQNMSFPDNSFDLIVSNLCIHNISKKEGRDKVCREIARVLKPGGIALISDIKAKRYAGALRQAGLETSRCGSVYFDLLPPIDIIKAVKV